MGNDSAVDALLKHWPEDVLKVDRMKRSVLWHAACGNSEHIMRALIKAGAPLGMVDDRGFAPIHVAALLGNDASLRVLMQEGANINLPLDDGFNLPPIQLAVTHRQTASLEILLKARAQLSHACLPNLSFHLFYMAIANGSMRMAYRIWQEVEDPFNTYKRVPLDLDWHPACIVNMVREEPLVPCWMCIHRRRIFEMMEGLGGPAMYLREGGYQRGDFVDHERFKPRELLEQPTFEWSRGNRLTEFVFKLGGH
ncbi:ankyrin repeat protein [Apiospora marii]|uniref:Ankyrin repeat protein n=1 Tax=Apiospora marii TaxID=335849 RepID=A0ABR1SAT1_9PEZI